MNLCRMLHSDRTLTFRASAGGAGGGRAADREDELGALRLTPCIGGDGTAREGDADTDSGAVKVSIASTGGGCCGGGGVCGVDGALRLRSSVRGACEEAIKAGDSDDGALRLS